MPTREIVQCWEDLANAIIEQAVDDWTAAQLILRRDFDNCDAIRVRRDVERFIHSEYFHTLTNIKPDVLMTLMRKRLNHVMRDRRRRYRDD